jgi:hypothetical protein
MSTAPNMSPMIKLLRDGDARRERQRNWKEYDSKDGSMTIYYEKIDCSYDDEFGRVEKYQYELRKVVANVTDDENYTGAAQDLLIEVEANDE